MSARPLEHAAPDARAARAIAIPSVDPRDVAAARLLRACAFPAGVREEIGRAAHETLAMLLPSAGRPAFELVSDSGRIRFDEGALEPRADASIADAAFELVRGRAGIRVARTSAEPVWRCGWLVTASRPALLRDGDVVTTAGRRFDARYVPPQPRALVELGPARRADGPSRAGFEFRFTLEPAGEPLVVHCDGPSGRALLDVACGGDGSRPFDPTALGEVDRAVIDWIVNRTAQSASQSLFDADAALRPSPQGAGDPEWWFAAAVRVGGYHGVWWLGATGRGVEAAARLMRPRRERDARTDAALERVAVVLVARARLGRASVDELATIGPGDVFVSRGGLALVDGYAVGACLLEVVGADGPAAPATLVARGDGLAARVHAFRIGKEDGGMSENDRADGAGDAPFDAVLERIGVAVSVEIARRRMALGELLALSSGDVVELDGPPRNSVTLLIDGSPFARGELVDVDGALGVRVLAVGGRTT